MLLRCMVHWVMLYCGSMWIFVRLHCLEFCDTGYRVVVFQCTRSVLKLWFGGCESYFFLDILLGSMLLFCGNSGLQTSTEGKNSGQNSRQWIKSYSTPSNGRVQMEGLLSHGI